MTVDYPEPAEPKCRHAGGGALRCNYCGQQTCPTCHHARRHLKACPETRTRETRGRA